MKSGQAMQVDKVIETLVRRYAVKYPHADRDDLGQVAWEAAERARRCWAPDGGAALSSYVWLAVNRALYQEVVREWSPVHAGSRKAGDLLQTHAITYDPEAHDQRCAPPTDVLVDRARAFRRLRDIIAAQPDGAAALEYLLADEPAAVVARRYGVKAAHLRRAAREACAAAAADARLRTAARCLGC